MEEHFWAVTGGDGSRFVAITDPGSKLAARAEERGFRRTFLNRADIGGRFSALSYFGLVPAVLAGISITPLLDNAVAVLERSGPDADPAENEPLQLGALLGDSVAAGRDKLTIIADPVVGSIGLWLEQLIAESTGKEGTGVVPLADERLGVPEAYGDDRLFAYLRRDGTHDDSMEALEQAGFPVHRCKLAGLDGIAGQMVTWELATAYCGACSASTRSTSRTCRRRRTTWWRRSTATRRRASSTTSDAGDLVRGARGAPPAAARFLVIQAYVTPDGHIEGGAAGSPRRAARSSRGRHPARLRAALPAFHRPAATRVAPARASTCRCCPAPLGRRDPRSAVRLPDGDRGAEPRRCPGAAGHRGSPSPASTSTRSPTRARRPGSGLMADREPAARRVPHAPRPRLVRVVIFGGLGDLGRAASWYPALYNLYLRRLLPAGLRDDRHRAHRSGWRRRATGRRCGPLRVVLSRTAGHRRRVGWLREMLSWITGTFDDAATYTELAEAARRGGIGARHRRQRPLLPVGAAEPVPGDRRRARRLPASRRRPTRCAAGR
jgi:hypothetical protein